MPIPNVRVKLDGIELQVNANGVVAHKLQILDDYMPWLSRQAITATREDDDSLGFDVTMLTGKRIRVVFGTSTIAVPENNNSRLDSLYRKVLQTSFDISGTGLELADAHSIFTIYKAHQVLWGKRAQLLTKIQDPDITVSTKASILTELNALSWTPVPLSLMGGTYNVIFGEGMTCQFTEWVVGNYTDFSFNLVQREPLV